MKLISWSSKFETFRTAFYAKHKGGHPMIRELKYILPRGMLIRCIARMPWHDNPCGGRSWIIDLATERVSRQPRGFGRCASKATAKYLLRRVLSLTKDPALAPKPRLRREAIAFSSPSSLEHIKAVAGFEGRARWDQIFDPHL